MRSQQGFTLIDCQIPTPHLSSLGAMQITREEFLNIMARALENPREF